jgi:hypothetical protein
MCFNASDVLEGCSTFCPSRAGLASVGGVLSLFHLFCAIPTIELDRKEYCDAIPERRELLLDGRKLGDVGVAELDHCTIEFVIGA